MPAPAPKHFFRQGLQEMSRSSGTKEPWRMTNVNQNVDLCVEKSVDDFNEMNIDQ